MMWTNTSGHVSSHCLRMAANRSGFEGLLETVRDDDATDVRLADEQPHQPSEDLVKSSAQLWCMRISTWCETCAELTHPLCLRRTC